MARDAGGPKSLLRTGLDAARAGEDNVIERIRSVWPATAVGVLVTLVGGWVFFVPLVGSYFDFGFFTDASWDFSSVHWILLLGPGLVAGMAGLLMILGRSRAVGWFATTAALLAGVWLIVGPTLHSVWGSEVAPITTTGGEGALRWIGYFYGPGALLVFLAGLVAGVLATWARRPESDSAVDDFSETTQERKHVLAVR